jgi:predicted PurR-regulated permease PerM
MFGLEPRTLKIVWTVFLFAMAMWLIHTIGATIIVFTLAVFLAHLLGPIVQRIEQAIPDKWISRNLSLAIVYVAMLAAIAAIGIPVIAQVGEQGAALASKLPTVLKEDPITKLQLPYWLEPMRDRIVFALHDGLANLDEKLLPILKDVGSNLAGFLGSALSVILIPILSFFFLLDSFKIKTAIVDVVPAEHRAVADEIIQDLHILLVQYIRALVLLALLVFVIYALFLSATGVAYPVLLATIAAFLEVIPIAGPLVASLAIVLVALLTGFPHVWWLVLFLIVFRLLQDYVVSPKLMSAGVEIHPLVVLFGVLAGEQIAGIPGMFFSVPVIAALRIVVVQMRRKNLKPEEKQIVVQ